MLVALVRRDLYQAQNPTLLKNRPPSVPLSRNHEKSKRSQPPDTRIQEASSANNSKFCESNAERLGGSESQVKGKLPLSNVDLTPILDALNALLRALDPNAGLQAPAASRRRAKLLAVAPNQFAELKESDWVASSSPAETEIPVGAVLPSRPEHDATGAVTWRCNIWRGAATT